MQILRDYVAGDMRTTQTHWGVQGKNNSSNKDRLDPFWRLWPTLRNTVLASSSFSSTLLKKKLATYQQIKQIMQNTAVKTNMLMYKALLKATGGKKNIQMQLVKEHLEGQWSSTTRSLSSKNDKLNEEMSE